MRAEMFRRIGLEDLLHPVVTEPVMQLPENDGADGVGYGVDYPVFPDQCFPPSVRVSMHRSK